MIDIVIRASGQRLAIVKRPEVIVAGTRGVMRITFELSMDWYGYRVVADFDGDAVPLTSNMCVVPDSMTGRSSIPVRLIGDNGSARMCSEVAHIIQRRG